MYTLNLKMIGLLAIHVTQIIQEFLLYTTIVSKSITKCPSGFFRVLNKSAKCKHNVPPSRHIIKSSENVTRTKVREDKELNPESKGN